MFEDLAFQKGSFPVTKGNPPDLCLMRHFDTYYPSDATVFATKGAHTIGRIYDKVLYREYEDASFTKEKPHPKYLGFLGPILKGEIGDTIVVHFKNSGSRVYSMHPHGVFYSKDSEGALYEDNTAGKFKKDDKVPPGGTHTYSWHLTQSHAPADQEDKCITWIYHSHVVPSKDINTGLLGEILLSMSFCLFIY